VGLQRGVAVNEPKLDMRETAENAAKTEGPADWAFESVVEAWADEWPVDASAQPLLARAALRMIYSAGQRLTLARFAFPHDGGLYSKLLKDAAFKDDQAIDINLDWIFRHEDTAPFEPALLALLDACSARQVADLFQRMNQERRQRITGGLSEAFWGKARGIPLKHHRLLGLIADDSRRGELAGLYEQVEPVVLRGLLRQIGPGADAGYLPVWRARLREAPPSTRKEVVLALARLEVEAVEPTLREVLREDTDAAVQRAAAAGLGQLGSRASLEVLEAAAGDRSLREAAQTATAAIRERHPAERYPRPGGFSLTAGDHGAIALAAEAGAGALSPAESEQTHARESGSEARSQAAEAPAAPGVLYIEAPPRWVPPGLWWVRFTYSQMGCGVLLFWPCLGAGPTLLVAPLVDLMRPGTVEPGQILLVAALWVVVGIVLYIGVIEHRRVRRILREGVPTTVRLKQRDVERRGKNRPKTYHLYQFVVAGEDGRHYRHTHKSRTRLSLLEDDRDEPALYIPDSKGAVEALLLLDSIPELRLDSRGRLHIKPQALVLSSLAALWILGFLLFFGKTFLGSGHL